MYNRRLSPKTCRATRVALGASGMSSHRGHAKAGLEPLAEVSNSIPVTKHLLCAGHGDGCLMPFITLDPHSNLRGKGFDSQLTDEENRPGKAERSQEEADGPRAGVLGPDVEARGRASLCRFPFPCWSPPVLSAHSPSNRTEVWQEPQTKLKVKGQPDRIPQQSSSHDLRGQCGGSSFIFIH